MPTYEFRCPAGHDFEKFYRKISDGPTELACPVCARIAARRVSGGAGLVFKGQGFYITDYGKDGKKGAPSAERSGGEPKPAEKPSDGAAPVGGATESKPAESKPAEAAKPKSKVRDAE